MKSNLIALLLLASISCSFCFQKKPKTAKQVLKQRARQEARNRSYKAEQNENFEEMFQAITNPKAKKPKKPIVLPAPEIDASQEEETVKQAIEEPEIAPASSRRCNIF